MNSVFESVKCVICDRNNSDKIHEFKYLNSKLNLVLCKSCGLGYLNPRWTKEQYLIYYKERYDETYRPDLKVEKRKQHPKKINIVLERFKTHNISFTNAKKILDIGSGAGENLMAFKQEYSQLECYGIEPSLASQKLLKQQNINIIADDVDSDWEKTHRGKFDIIIMRHVLEHFLNPLEVLKKVNGVLNKNGILYIAVPNNLVEKRNEGWLRVAHTYYFNKFTLTLILNKASLKINSIFSKDEFSNLEIYVFSQRNNNNITNVKNIVSKKTYKAQKKVFSVVFKKENYLKRIKIFIRKKIKNF